MNKLLYILGWLLLLAGCQTIGEDEQLVPVGRDEVRSNRTTLICEYSGYKCSNCPRAAEMAHTLQNLWGENLVVVEIHPPSNSFCQTKNPDNDYTCAAADIYYKAQPAWSSIGFPTGVVNMSSGFINYSEWGGYYMVSAVAQANVMMNTKVSYDASSRHLTAEVGVDNLEKNTQNLGIIAWLTEDSIVGLQRMPDGSSNYGYVHNHILRDTLTAAWGEPFVLSARYTTMLHYDVPEHFVAANCNLVVLVMREGEVIQVKQQRIN